MSAQGGTLSDDRGLRGADTGEVPQAAGTATAKTWRSDRVWCVAKAEKTGVEGGELEDEVREQREGWGKRGS